MAEIKHSKALEYILIRAKGTGEKPASLTAPRYILSALDVFAGKTEFEVDASEQRAFKSILAKFFPKDNDAFSALRSQLEEIVRADSSVSYMDNIYMQKMLFQAKENARNSATSEVSALDVLTLILKEPDKHIKGCISAEVEARIVPDNPFAEQVERSNAGDNSERPEGESQDREVIQNPKTIVSQLTEKVKKTHDALSKVIFGQDNAISVFTTGYFQAELSALTDKNRVKPRATFLFAGPPGVGKTFLAEKAAEILEIPFMRFDMSEYSDKEATLEFIGSDKVYKGAKEGNVTGFVARNPKCVLLFDEIEKAHINIIHLFLQLLDAGRLRDSFTDTEVAFTDAIIIFTTNAGKQLYENSEASDFSGITRKVILNALQKDTNAATGMPFFPAAICSRFASGNVVMFNHITASNLRTIAKNEISRHAQNFEQSFGIKVKIDELVYTALLFAEGGAADARSIRSRAETFFDDELFELFRLIDAKTVESSIENLESISITAELPEDNRDIQKLFTDTEKPEVLLVSSQQVAKRCQDSCTFASFVLAQNTSAAKKILQSHDIRFALIDIGYKRRGKKSYLNIEDVESTARDIFWYIREQYGNLPIYILQSDDTRLNAEERTSFRRLGVRDVLTLTNDQQAFSETLQEASETLHQQNSMNELARSNKLISFETAQIISSGGKAAEIKLFDFEMAVAVDAEDKENILSSVSKPDVSFDQIIGAGDAKKELHYFVEYLKNPRRYLGTGVDTPKGVLLYGPPGTGKTMLAKATASESNVTFIAAEGNQFLKRYVGEGPEAIHELFRTARKYAPSILFIDEIDAIAKNRTGEDGNNSGDILTAFLTEMDGFKKDPSRPVFVLAATNFDVDPSGSRSLDAAFLRRFDRRILVDLPNQADRLQYIRMRMAGNPALTLSEDELTNIAVRSTGMSLADLASIIELALRSAIRDGDLKVTDEIFEESFETFSSGEAKHWDSAQLERVARHEAGHAFLCWESGETPSYLTIVARGKHGGYMQHDSNEGKAIYTKAELLARLRTSLGGRAAEIVYYGEEQGLSTGAGGDLQNATSIARSILCAYGMDREFGLSYIDAGAVRSGEMSTVVRIAVNQLLASEMQTAIKMISDNRKSIDALVSQLLTRNHLTGQEINQILSSQ